MNHVQLLVSFICFVVYLSLHLNNYFNSKKLLTKICKIIKQKNKFFILNNYLSLKYSNLEDKIEKVKKGYQRCLSLYIYSSLYI